MKQDLNELCSKINECKNQKFVRDENAIQGFVFKQLGCVGAPATAFAVYSEEEYESKLESLEDWQKKYRYYYCEDFAYPEEKSVIFILFNPSTASPFKDDPTIRNCRQLALKNYSCMEIVNIFAERNSDIKALSKENNELNNEFLKVFLKDRANTDVVIAWGYGKEKDYAEEIAKIKELIADNKKFYISDSETELQHHPAPPELNKYGGVKNVTLKEIN